MRSRKTFVYFQAINRGNFQVPIRTNTWYLYTTGSTTSCFRDYSSEVVQEIRTNATEAENFLQMNAHYSERVDCFHEIPVTNVLFWKEQTQLRANELLLPGKVGNLQEDFDAIFEQSRKSPNPHLYLEERIQNWTQKFEKVKEKTEFNHWDNDDSTDIFPITEGRGWTSRMLELSRKAGRPHWIETGDPRTEFSLVSMELGLGISSKSNPFHPGCTDYIKPDGLGVRRNGFFTLIEVKGPLDEADFQGPLLQATCGALAIFAKRRMIEKIARTQADLRPEYRNAKIPPDKRSIGIHLLLAKRNARHRKRFDSWWNETGETTCAQIYTAFRKIEYIAYSFVDHTAKNPFATIPINQSYPRSFTSCQGRL